MVPKQTLDTLSAELPNLVNSTVQSLLLKTHLSSAIQLKIQHQYKSKTYKKSC